MYEWNVLRAITCLSIVLLNATTNKEIIIGLPQILVSTNLQRRFRYSLGFQYSGDNKLTSNRLDIILLCILAFGQIVPKLKIMFIRDIFDPMACPKIPSPLYNTNTFTLFAGPYTISI